MSRLMQGRENLYAGSKVEWEAVPLGEADEDHYSSAPEDCRGGSERQSCLSQLGQQLHTASALTHWLCKFLSAELSSCASSPCCLHPCSCTLTQPIKLLLQRFQVQVVELFVRGIHQRGLVAADDVAVVGGSILQATHERKPSEAGLSACAPCANLSQPTHPNSMSKRSRSQSRERMLMVLLVNGNTWVWMRLSPFHMTMSDICSSCAGAATACDQQRQQSMMCHPVQLQLRRMRVLCAVAMMTQRPGHSQRTGTALVASC